MPIIIKKILEKYNLQKAQEKGLEEFFKSQSSEERTRVFNNLPGTKISKLVVEHDEGRISLEDLPFYLKEALNISEKEANEIAEELENKILTPARPRPAIEERKPVEEPKKPDTYLEPIE